MVDRIGASTRTLSIADRPGAAGPVLRGPLDPDSRYPVGPLPPAAPVAVGAVLDAADAPQLPNPALQALAESLAELADPTEAAAMRPNQVFLSRQLVWHPPDAAMMAASWQVMVRTYGQQRAAWLEQAGGQHLPASLFMADHNPSAVRDGRPGLPLVTELEPWRFSVLAWGAERLVLKVVSKDDDETPARGRRRTRVALRLELVLPELGRVTVELEPGVSNGVLMDVATAHAAALQHLRELMPTLSALISRSGLTLLRCRLRRELPPAAAGSYPTEAQTAMLSAPLFKAMADMAVLLSQPAAAGSATSAA